MLYIVPTEENITFNHGKQIPLIPKLDAVDELQFYCFSRLGGKKSIEFVFESDKTYMHVESEKFLKIREW